MSLTSAAYRLQAPEATYDPVAARKRLRSILKRLVAAHGVEEVRRRVRDWPVNTADEVTKAWIMLNLWDEEDHHVPPSFPADPATQCSVRTP